MIKLLLLLLLCSIANSHFHSIKDFESTLTKCCTIGIEKTVTYQTSVVSNSKKDVCLGPFDELSEVAHELRPQCLSIARLCCTREIEKQICRFSRSLVKGRLDNTEFSLTKNNNSIIESNKSNGLYEQCLPDPNDLQSDRSTAKLFSKIVKLTGDQIYSECCVACKLGLFSALNDYKCIIQKNIRPSKLFEETFYDCCLNLKRELDVSSGKTIDIATMELLIYPELKQKIVFPLKPAATERSTVFREPDYSWNDKFPFKHFEQKLMMKSNMMENHRTQIVPDKVVPTEPKNFDNEIRPHPSDCPQGMRAYDHNRCVFIDMCKEKVLCKEDEKCVNLNPGWKCVKESETNKSRQEVTQEISAKKVKKDHEKSKESVAKIVSVDPFNEIAKEIGTQVDATSKISQLKSSLENQIKPKRPAQQQPAVNFFALNPIPRSNLNSANRISNPYMHDQSLKPFYPLAYSNAIRNQAPNQMKSFQRGFSKRKIDKCKIGNHNCNLTQTCRKKDDNFVCVNNQDLENYDRAHPYVPEDYLTTILPINPSNLLDNRLKDEKLLVKTCQVGFELNDETGVCEDLNECALGLHNCTEGYRCDNKIGSFICVREPSCGTGYTYNVDTRLCEDINECKNGQHNCREPYRCINYQGTFRCELNRCKNGRWMDNRCVQMICPSGYAFNTLSERCVDIDECLMGVNPNELNLIISNRNENNVQFDLSKLERLNNGRIAACAREEKCVNNVGGFVCQNNEIEPIKSAGETMGRDAIADAFKPKCQTGERYDAEMRRCVLEADCKVLQNPSARMLDSRANERTKYCGFKCVKLNGEWTCVCPSGYNLRRDGSRCVDVDECISNSGICDASNSSRSYCVNTHGSYKCVDVTCPDGYTENFKNKLQCEIINKANIIQLNKPKYVSYSFITIESDISLTNDQIRIASIRRASNLDVNFVLTSANSSNQEFNAKDLARLDDFHLKREDSDHIFLKRSLRGPQEIQIEFNYKSKSKKREFVMNRLLLTIYISEFRF